MGIIWPDKEKVIRRALKEKLGDPNDKSNQRVRIAPKQECKYCKTTFNISRGSITPILPIPRIEEMIDRWGRGTWFSETEKDKDELTETQQEELLEMVVYDNLINTLELGYSCNSCRTIELSLYDKYYPEVTGENLTKIAENWSVDDHQNRFKSYGDWKKANNIK